jgi:NAD(P)-dependent dehydrogenase (short-subunit alcohol dehydrogenase family)
MIQSHLAYCFEDAGVPEDNVRIVNETVDKLGGLDIIIANAGWTRFSDFKDLNAMSLEEWNKVSTRPPS